MYGQICINIDVPGGQIATFLSVAEYPRSITTTERPAWKPCARVAVTAETNQAPSRGSSSPWAKIEKTIGKP